MQYPKGHSLRLARREPRESERTGLHDHSYAAGRSGAEVPSSMTALRVNLTSGFLQGGRDPARSLNREPCATVFSQVLFTVVG